MKKRICFAGFGDEEFEALQPSLATLNGVWDCVFSPDAASALDALAAAPCDAAVANLTPRGINDSELLQQAAIRHPRTLRFVLGDVMDRELIVNCMGVAHQFISRPWKPPELVSIIERSLALDAWLSNDKLRAFVPRLGKLPSLPATYFEVLKKAESPDSSVDSIAEVIARDPALTVRLLQMVNSPACGLTEKITSPNQAVSRLGLETVKALVLCLQLFSQSEPVAEASFSLDQLWHHSFSVAKIAAKIVQHSIASERMASDCYTAGLLHNIGQIVLATNLSAEYSAVVETARKRKCSLQEIEKEQLGVTSNQVGAYLLGLWGMPLPLVEATALYPAPASATTVEFTVLTVVHIANVLACEENGPVKGLPQPKLDSNYLATLGLPKKSDDWRKLLATPPNNAAKAESYAAERSSSSRSEKKAGSPHTAKLLVIAGIAALAVVALVFMKNAIPVAHQVGSAIAAKFSPTTSETKAAEAPASASAFDSIKLQGIVYNSRQPAAMINGKLLQIKDQINGVEVVAMTASNVVLSCKGEQKTFTLK